MKRRIKILKVNRFNSTSINKVCIDFNQKSFTNFVRRKRESLRDFKVDVYSILDRINRQFYLEQRNLWLDVIDSRVKAFNSTHARDWIQRRELEILDKLNNFSFRFKESRLEAFKSMSLFKRIEYRIQNVPLKDFLYRSMNDKFNRFARKYNQEINFTNQKDKDSLNIKFKTFSENFNSMSRYREDIAYNVYQKFKNNVRNFL